MADILIKGMELPKEGNVYLIIGEDGVVSEKIGSMYHVTTEAIELPTHGRLIDADRLPVSTLFYHHANGVEIETLEVKLVYLKDLHNAPTVLEATK